jgi:adenylate cyclase 1
VCASQDLYSQSYSRVGVLFASITNFHEFYIELDLNNQVTIKVTRGPG